MFDSLLLASYGGPERLDEIEPFLDKILSGKPCPPARRAAIVERYKRFGGVSPLPEECRKFLAEFAERSESLTTTPKIYWGNMFSSPTFDDAFLKMEQDEVHNVLVLISSAFGSPQSCRRYHDLVEEAFHRRSERFVQSCKLCFIPPFFDSYAFVRSLADEILSALAWDVLEDDLFTSSPKYTGTSPNRLLLFSAHSIPTSDGLSSLYREQLFYAVTQTIKLILEAPGFGGSTKEEFSRTNDHLLFLERKLNLDSETTSSVLPTQERDMLKAHDLDAALVFQSRSGSPRTPWLEPDARDFLVAYKKENPQLKRVVVSPLGFFFENMETIYDLDVELQDTCKELGLVYRRARCNGVSPRFSQTALQLTRLCPEQIPQCSCATVTCDLSCRTGGKSSHVTSNE